MMRLFFETVDKKTRWVLLVLYLLPVTVMCADRGYHSSSYESLCVSELDFVQALKNGDAVKTKALIAQDCGINLNKYYPSINNTPLRYAIQLVHPNSLEICNILLENGARVDGIIINEEGQEEQLITPILDAINFFYMSHARQTQLLMLQKIKLLLDHGASKDQALFFLKDVNILMWAWLERKELLESFGVSEEEIKQLETAEKIRLQKEEELKRIQSGGASKRMSNDSWRTNSEPGATVTVRINFLDRLASFLSSSQ
ncbi:MAG: hypothetical protein H6679_01045 [Epsilonproteobacteria bacterium]|nr:hypothetical protein [Campylobacterota bacterium]